MHFGTIRKLILERLLDLFPPKTDVFLLGVNIDRIYAKHSKNAAGAVLRPRKAGLKTAPTDSCVSPDDERLFP